MRAARGQKNFTSPSLVWKPMALAAILSAAALAATAQSPSQVSVAPTPDAQILSIDRGSAGLWQLLLKLHTRASLINIVGHPDDEDGGMLTYESRGQGVRAALLQMNRGEGGQNAVGNDYWDAIGLDRTEELLGSGRYYGVNQYFTTVIDYGFSKLKSEALDKWGHERVLGDVVRVVRMVRPLVVTSVNVGGPTDGHANHQVAGETAQEVFNAAGDPNAFPEQIKEGLRPWTPLKMYARAPNVGARGILDQGTGQLLPVRFQDYINNTRIDGALPVNLRISTGTYDPLLGASYLQIAREGLSLQKTQNGGGGVAEPGPASTGYHRFASRVQTTDQEKTFFDGIDITLLGIADLAKDADSSFLREGLTHINSDVEQAMSQFSAVQTEKAAPALAEGLKATNALIEQVQTNNLSEQAKYDVLHELRVKQAQFNNALALALGLSLDSAIAPAQAPGGGRGGPGGRAGGGRAGAGEGGEGAVVAGPVGRGGPGGFGGAPLFQFAIPGQDFFVRAHVVNQGTEAVQLSRIWLEGPSGEDWKLDVDGKENEGDMAGGSAMDQRFSVKVPDNAAPTKPYYTRPNVEQAYYDLIDARYRDLPLGPYPLSAWAEFTYNGVAVRLAQVVQRPIREFGLGTLLDPLMVAPAISIAISPGAGIVPLGAKEFRVTATIKSEVKGPAKGTVHLELPAGWRTIPTTASFSTTTEGEEQGIAFRVQPGQIAEKPYNITAVADCDGKQYRSGFVTTGYPGLRPYNLYSPATYRTSGVNVKIAPGLNVAYIEGTGDDVPQSLENLGIHVHFLNAQDIATSDLHRFDVILLGVRTYTARPELATNNGRLLDYVKNGGVVIIQYQSGVQYESKYGPYPFQLDGTQGVRVVEETGEAQILDAKSPMLSWPNRITLRDFGGWIEERGHGFMTSWDPHYAAPIEMHDQGQDAQKGGLLMARYGKGAYVYVAFAFYRQLPEGVPGGYRLIANLLSLPKNPELAGPSKTATSRPAKPATKAASGSGRRN